jgi:hypothetical protein
MEEETEKTKPTRGLRWTWEKLAKATTKEEVEQVLAEAASMVGDGDVEITGSVPGKGYVKLMGDAYLAYKYGEIEKPGTKQLLDRALAVYSNIYLRLLAKSRRER